MRVKVSRQGLAPETVRLTVEGHVNRYYDQEEFRGFGWPGRDGVFKVDWREVKTQRKIRPVVSKNGELITCECFEHYPPGTLSCEQCGVLFGEPITCAELYKLPGMVETVEVVE